MNMVVYNGGNNASLTIWDLNAGKMLSAVDFISRRAPLWLSNGKQFVVDGNISTSWQVTKYDLFLVGVDGEVKRLTYLADWYDFVQVGSYSESADGRYIAFWFTPSSGSVDITYHLAVYDMFTGAMTGYCVQSVVDYNFPFAPIWAPDGHQLLAAGYLDTKDNYGTIFVDVDKGILSQVDKGVVPVGWMVSP